MKYKFNFLTPASSKTLVALHKINIGFPLTTFQTTRDKQNKKTFSQIFQNP